VKRGIIGAQCPLNVIEAISKAGHYRVFNGILCAIVPKNGLD